MNRRPPIILAAIALVLGSVAMPRAAQADATPPVILFDNGLRLTTNERPQFQTGFPLRTLIDGDPSTTWVFESLVTATPELRILVPEEQRADRLILVNGCAEDAALPRMNDATATVSHAGAGGAEVFRRKLARSEARQSVGLAGTSGRTIQVRLEVTVPAEQRSDTCLAGLDLTAGGRSLLDTQGYIARSGGEYPAYALYLDGSKVTDFPTDHIMEAFFIADGNYAVFVHWEAPGVTVYNLARGASRVLLEDVLVVYQSLHWRGGRFEGRQMNPPEGPDTPFSRKVALP